MGSPDIAKIPVHLVKAHQGSDCTPVVGVDQNEEMYQLSVVNYEGFSSLRAFAQVMLSRLIVPEGAAQ